MNRDITIILGKTGYGKSLFAKLLSNRHPRLFVYDPARSYPVNFQRVPDLVQTMEKSGYWVKPGSSFRVGGIEPDACQVLGNAAFIAGECLYVIEEAASVFPVGLAFNQKPTVDVWNWLKRLTYFGRHRSCSLAIIAQRAGSIPIALRSQATRVISFQQHEADDTGWLAGFYSVQGYADLPKLEVLECLDWWRGTESRYSIRPACEKSLGIRFDTDYESMRESVLA